jgi:hypothetical protein
MSLTLTWLVDQQLRNLTGAHFKLAAYLYRRLQRKPELTIRAKDLAKATGLSEKGVQSASNHLAQQNIIDATGGPGTTKTYRLPAAQPPKPGAAKAGGSNTSSAPPPPGPEPVIEKPDPKRMEPGVAPPKPEAANAGELPRSHPASSFSAPPAASTAERPAPLPGNVKPERVAPVVTPPATTDVIESGRKPEAAGVTQPPQPPSSSPAPPAVIKAEPPAPPAGKVKPEPVVDSGRVTEAAYQPEIEALLAAIFRLVNSEEQADLEKSAGGKQQLLACLRAFKQRKLSFVRDNLDLFGSAIANLASLLQRY